MRFCDVSLPVPLDQPFTYELPETLRHRVAPGCRVVVPFGPRRLTGVVLRVHDDAPNVETREALRLLDAQPVLDAELLALGKWLAAYYCAPLGEVLRGMLPLASEIRRGKIYSLTDAGRDAARQLVLEAAVEDPVAQVLRALESRPLSAAYLMKKLPLADKAIKSLEKRGFILPEQIEEDRDPLRAASDRLRVELAKTRPDAKLTKPERELVAFLELHPGTHPQSERSGIHREGREQRSACDLAHLPETRRAEARADDDGQLRPLPRAARAEPAPTGGLRADSRRHRLAGIQDVPVARRHRVEAKTEVYLVAIDTALAAGRGALLLVPEIALTPAMAGQFFARFGDRVAILHSAFTDSERAEQWRKIRSGAAGVVVGTRSGVRARPQSGPDRGR